ncbi:hypothetical protein DH2020_032868 [Rehmannia glutinosa]|uniref:Uncharacterized protein n=1 Tax=Rehmannia glutinosa TaxID=99300 RepID=A0ABR0VDY5_REHGL
MAAPPVKSQPLHNFSLPHLKWAHKNSSSSAAGTSSHHHRFRRRDSPDQHRHRYPDLESDQPTNPSQQPPTPAEEENGEAKPWKLRPRKEVIKAASTCKNETGAENNDNKINSNSNVVKSQRLRGLVEGGQQNGGVERKGKRRVWISLSREEIEEDIYALTGGKPARRPKKWPKNVQKQLDVLMLLHADECDTIGLQIKTVFTSVYAL